MFVSWSTNVNQDIGTANWLVQNAQRRIGEISPPLRWAYHAPTLVSNPMTTPFLRRYRLQMVSSYLLTLPQP